MMASVPPATKPTLNTTTTAVAQPGNPPPLEAGASQDGLPPHEEDAPAAPSTKRPLSKGGSRQGSPGAMR